MKGICPVVLLCLHVVSLSFGLPYTTPFFQVPFLTVWNAPTARCYSQFGIDLDLGVFSIVHNQNQSFMGDNITIFYADKLGHYPMYSQGMPIYGGVPQNASLDEHLRVAADDIWKNIPDKDIPGLAVVDWESWRPIWARNWDSKQVYWEASRALVKAKHPEWNPQQVEVAAKNAFTEAGREFMAQTISLGQALRPARLWGYYGFPNCYNYYSPKIVNYTGQCPPIEIKRNNELFWLWNISSALYPDIYLSLDMDGLHNEVLLYTQHRILEAMRVGALAASSAPPVYTYSRIVYTYSLAFLSQEHLMYTIGESAALGSAGVVLWGDSAYAKSQATCEAVKAYIDQTLGYYLVNVTAAATFCSQVLCSSRGRCQRIDPASKAYLHLDPAVWKVVAEKKPGGGHNYKVLGQMRYYEVISMKAQFQCKCYHGWSGERCSEPVRG